MSAECLLRGTVKPPFRALAVFATTDVRFGSKADICGAKSHVRFTPESDIKCDRWGCPLRAKSGLMQCSKKNRYSITSSVSPMSVGDGDTKCLGALQVDD
jgi:hypothetical protein